MKVLLAAALIALVPSAHADLALAQKKNCMSCHAVDMKILGPSFKDVASKYAKDKKAVDTLTQKIIKGGSGVWGNAVMPPSPGLTPDEAKKLATWVLATK